MNKKPTLTQRVTTLEQTSQAQTAELESTRLRTSYTEVNTIQLAEDARKARQDARAASIVSFGALVLVLALAIMEALR